MSVRKPSVQPDFRKGGPEQVGVDYNGMPCSNM